MELEVILLAVFALVLWLFFTYYSLKSRSFIFSVFALAAAMLLFTVNLWIGLITVLLSAVLLFAGAMGARI